MLVKARLGAVSPGEWKRRAQAHAQLTHIQALEDKLTTANTLLQQLVDKANQPTPNTLTTPTNQTVPDQTALVSNGHISNKS